MDEKQTRKRVPGGTAEGASVGDEVAGARPGGRGAGELREPYRGPGRPNRLKKTARPEAGRERAFTGEQRLLMLDTWLRSKLPATEFSELVGVRAHTLYSWRKRFEKDGPAGLVGRRKGAKGSRLPEPVRRAILMMKEQRPDWGQDRLHDMLLRSEGLQASPGAIQRVLLEAGYEVSEVSARPNAPKVKRFESARPNVLWQTDLFTFMLKRERRRVHLVAYLDDHSRYIVGFGLHATASGAMVRESFEEAIANFGAPRSILCDNGSQFVTWRGTSAFKKLCQKRGIEQIVASPRRPQTLGKVERFWGTLHRELLDGAIFAGMEDAKLRIAHFIGFYNFQRTHQGIDGLVPADRYFEASAEVRAAIEARVAENAKALALHGEPRKTLYFTGKVGGESVSLHTEGDKVLLTDAEGVREAVDLKAEGKRVEPSEEGPGESVLDEVLEELEGQERKDEEVADDA
jgi:transposase InsO family protein